MNITPTPDPCPGCPHYCGEACKENIPATRYEPNRMTINMDHSDILRENNDIVEDIQFRLPGRLELFDDPEDGDLAWEEGDDDDEFEFEDDDFDDDEFHDDDFDYDPDFDYDWGMGKDNEESDSVDRANYERADDDAEVEDGDI